MGYREIAQYHFDEMKKWDKLIEGFEAEALRKAEEQLASRPMARGWKYDINWVANGILKDNAAYKGAVANRNGHRDKMKAYALADRMDLE